MKRRFSTRDAELTARMALTLVLTLGLYATVPVIVAAIVLLEQAWKVYVIVIACAVVAAFRLRYTTARNLVLNAVGATSASPGLSHLRGEVGRLAQLADVRAPEVFVVESAAANAFTVTSGRGSVIVVTTGLLDRLETPEVQAVLAHELTHLANRDAVVLTFASVPRVLGETIIGDPSFLFLAFFFVWPLGVPFWAIGSLLTLALSRYREFAADRGSALLTGRPQDLAAALERLSEARREIPNDDLRALGAAEALCIVSTGGSRWAFLRDHPPLEQRVARLEAIAREQGEPVGP